MMRLVLLLVVGASSYLRAQSAGPVPLDPNPGLPVRGITGGMVDPQSRFEYQPQIVINNQSAAQLPSGGFGGLGFGGFGGWGMPIGGVFVQDPMNGYLSGVASVTAATGQYWNDIQQARIMREQARQMRNETVRRRVELEAWYESRKMKTQDLIDNQVRTELERARRDPPMTEIWSGQALNALLNNILKHPRPTSGPNIPLSSEILRGINLVDRATRGNISLAKDEGRIAWPLGLQEEEFDGPRESFSKLFNDAISQINSGVTPDVKMVRQMRRDLDTMKQKLEDKIETISPGTYLSCRRTLNQLRDQVAGLSNPALCRSCLTWRQEAQTVADVVNVCLTKGLQFGAAVSPGDERAYTAFYFQLRNYERGLMSTPR
ncbi:MAG: hypothetical protein SNJ82_14125 [Gemmataceae bacterium]